MTPSHALGTAWTPADLLATLLVACFVCAGGLAPGVALARRLHLGWAGALALAFAVSAALAAVVSLAGSAAHLPLEAGVALHAAGAVALVWWSLRLMRGQPALRADAPGLALSAAAAALALVERPWFRVSADAFYHVAAVRSLLASHALVVTDPFHGTAATVADPSSGVLHVMMAFVARLGAMDPADLFPGWTVLGAAVLALSFYVLARRVAGRTWAAGVATAAYLLADRFADFRALGYPNQVTMALVLLGVAMLSEAGEARSLAASTATVAVFAAASAMHVGDAELLFVAAVSLGAWMLLEAAVSRARTRAWDLTGPAWTWGTIAVAAVVSAPFVLPKFGVVSASQMVGTSDALASSGLLRLGPFVLARPDAFFPGGAVLFAATTALAVAMALPALARRDRAALAGLAVCSLPALLLVDPPLTTLAATSSYYNLVRISALLGFTAYVALAWVLGRVRATRAGVGAGVAGAALLAVAVAVAGPFLTTTWTEERGALRPGMNVSVWRSRAEDIRTVWGAGAVSRLRSVLGEGRPVVAADEGTGYYLSALASVRLVAAPPAHSPLAIELAQGAARRDAVRRLLDPAATEAERRAVLARWDVDYVLLWTSRRAERAAADSMRAQPALFEEIDASPRLVLFRVRP